MNKKSDQTKSVIQFIIALVVVLTGVSLGSILVMRHEAPRSPNNSTALGHRLPAPPPAGLTNQLNQSAGPAESR